MNSKKSQFIKETDKKSSFFARDCKYWLTWALGVFELEVLATFFSGNTGFEPELELDMGVPGEEETDLLWELPAELGVLEPPTTGLGGVNICLFGVLKFSWGFLTTCLGVLGANMSNPENLSDLNLCSDVFLTWASISASFCLVFSVFSDLWCLWSLWSPELELEEVDFLSLKRENMGLV